MKKILFLLTISLFSLKLFGQSLPNGYQNIKLGMSLDETKDQLQKNAEFGYHGDKDVSLLPSQKEVLIETDAEEGHGTPFLERCWFQFYDDNLYIITININKNRMDYYSMFKTFLEKYGNPTSIDPSKSCWKDDSVTIILEKPLSVKYIDNKTYEEIQKKATVEISAEEYTRELFLEDF